MLWINKQGLEGYIKDHDKRKALAFFKQTGRAPVEELLIHAIHEQGLKRILYFKPLPKGNVFLDKMVAKYGFRRNRVFDFLADFFCDPRTLNLPPDFLEKHKPIVKRLE
ncbi:hypothetical protein HZC09_04185 [Candidatus Micrarchaeota archaeon]|nr:hypothetical protein [Candidatus Micrarchaeota archaeon]